MEIDSELKDIAVQLYDIGAIKYGDFVTKVGLKTPIYVDLRLIVSCPQLLLQISKLLFRMVDDETEYSHVCGVPYTALPIASVITTVYKVPMIMRRKEAKSYGTKKMIEGIYKRGDKAVVIEDIITSGSSILETAQDLRNEGLEVPMALVVVDREQGGKPNLEAAGIKVKCLFKITKLIRCLIGAGRLSEESFRVVSDYVNNVKAPARTIKSARLSQDFRARAAQARNPVAARLLRLMADKQTSLCLAADVTQSAQLLALAELAGPHIAALKLHVDILEDFNAGLAERLRGLARRHDFLLMEDRKFADIGHVVGQQLARGMYRIADWADLVTAHAIPGPGILDGLAAGAGGRRVGVLVLAEMSTRGSLARADYAAGAVGLARAHDLVAGFVCQSDVFDEPGLVQLTPGVSLASSDDGLGQQYSSPEDVVSKGADLVVVGRAVTRAGDTLQALLQYKQRLFRAYLDRIDQDKPE